MDIKCPKCHSDNPDTKRFCGECGTRLDQERPIGPSGPTDEISVSHTKTLETPTEELTTGSTFAGRYQIIEELGKGGMGKVYKVHDKETNEKIALKLIKAEIASDKKTIERFKNELKTARNIRHKNICGMYELMVDKSMHYITMEYVSGGDLKKLIRRTRRLDTGTAISIAKQICEGLSEAHSQGIVHRDLKPNNIMIDDDGNARIMDFGIARTIKGKSITGSGVMIGTPEYMSPEQVEAKDVDQRSDIYSLGIVMFEMLTGKLPFEADTPFAIGVKHKSEIPKNPKEFNPQIPDDLNRVILRCLEKDKEKRYQSAGELRSELTTIEQGITTKERIILKRETESKITRKRFLPFLIPGILLLALIITIAAYFFFGRTTKKEILEPAQFSEIIWKNSVAVLPFEDFSQKKDQGYFCNGMTDAIIEKLSQIGELKVSSRTSMMRYINTDKDIKEIGAELGVATILEGSVQKEKDKILVRAKLINVEDNFHIWSHHYERKLEGVWDIQNNIANKIAAALGAELSPEKKDRLEKKPTENLIAYDYYLKGYEYYYRFRKQDNEHAIELFKRALELDPDFALAYAGLGDAYAQRVQRFGFPPTWVDEAIEVCEKAASIDPDCAEAYKALGLAYYTKGWLHKSNKAHHKAVELNPNYNPAITSLGLGYIQIGEFEESIRWTKKALDLGPALAYPYSFMGFAYLGLDDQAKAEEWLKKSISLQPDFDVANELLIYCYLAQGKSQKALEHSQKFLSVNPNSRGALEWAGHTALSFGNYEQAQEFYQKANLPVYLGYIYWKMGKQDEARKLFQKSINLYKAQLDQGYEIPDIPYFIACIHAIQGDKEKAYQWLRKAIDAGWRFYRRCLIDPLLENLHQDDQFKQIMEQMKQRVDEMRKQVQESSD